MPPAPPRAEPMPARLARELPEGPFLYEPKWDGFRCLAFVAGGDAVARLARESPAAFVAFDLLASSGEDLVARPLAERRARLEALLAGARPPLLLTPATRDPAVARRWLDRLHGRGVDGVVAKALDGPYEPGRRGWVKVKRERTAECVGAGSRTYAATPLVASLLLGMYDAAGALVHVGVSSSFPDRARRSLHDLLAPEAVPLRGHPWERGFNVGHSPVGRLRGSAGRWDPGEMGQDWTPLAPRRACEVPRSRPALVPPRRRRVTRARREDVEVVVEGRALRRTNLAKPLWRAPLFTKGDLLAYVRAVELPAREAGLDPGRGGAAAPPRGGARPPLLPPRCSRGSRRAAISSRRRRGEPRRALASPRRVDRRATSPYIECMARKLSTTVRLDPEDARALARARKDGLAASDLIRKGLRVVAARYYRNRRPPTTGLFVSTDAKLGEESELFRKLER